MSPKQGNDGERITVPLVAESAEVETRMVEGEVVSVRTHTTEDTVWVRDTLVAETITVDHVEIGEDIETRPTIRQEGDTTIIPIVEERLVVIKRLHLVKEIHIHRRRTARPFKEPVTLRRMEAVVERSQPDAPPQGSGDAPPR